MARCAVQGGAAGTATQQQQQQQCQWQRQWVGVPAAAPTAVPVVAQAAESVAAPVAQGLAREPAGLGGGGWLKGLKGPPRTHRCGLCCWSGGVGGQSLSRWARSSWHAGYQSAWKNAQERMKRRVCRQQDNGRRRHGIGRG
jgi:hypothetical protein